MMNSKTPVIYQGHEEHSWFTFAHAYKTFPDWKAKIIQRKKVFSVEEV